VRPTTRIVLAAKAVTPAPLWAVLKRLRGREEQPPGRPPPAPEWEYVPEGWQRAAGGWDVEAIAAAYRAKWPAYLAADEGTGPLGVDQEVPAGTPEPRDDAAMQQAVLAFGYALALAESGRGQVSLLDWGGGPGHYAVLARALLPGARVEYHSRDLPALTALGRELLPGDSFHDDDACLDRTYDLVLASSSLQYARDWRAALQRLAGATGRYALVTRLPVARTAPSFVVLQRAHAYGYETEYLGWAINVDELLETARAAGLELVRELLVPAWLTAAGAPETPTGHAGFLFSRAAPRSSA
jgi:putative methyltransferase (TIGR04325 family)